MQPQGCPDFENDFGYVFEFKNLIGFKTHHYEASDDFIRRLFDHFSVFELKHRAKYDRIKITKKGRSKYEFSVRPGHYDNFDNLDELLRKMNHCCHGGYEEEHEHICVCEFCFYPSSSYASNMEKRDFEEDLKNGLWL